MLMWRRLELVKVAAAVFALRGTRLTKAGTVQADIQLMKDRDAELYYSQRALKHVHKHIRRLTLQQPDVQWGFFTTGLLPFSSCVAFQGWVCLSCCAQVCPGQYKKGVACLRQDRLACSLAGRWCVLQCGLEPLTVDSVCAV